MYLKRGRGASYSGRGQPAPRGRFLPNSSSSRLMAATNANEFVISGNMEAPAIEAPVVAAAAIEAPPAEAPVYNFTPMLTEEQLHAKEHMRRMEERNRNRVRPPPLQYRNPSDYSGYQIERSAVNFPPNHDYTRPVETRPVITLSPEAQAYEEGEKHMANLEELGSRMFHSVMDGEGQGGRKKRKYTITKQKKQHRRSRSHSRSRRHSTKKYRK